MKILVHTDEFSYGETLSDFDFRPSGNTETTLES